MGGLGSGPSLKMRGFQSEKRDFGAKNNYKEAFFFLNKGIFDLARSEKRNKELYIFEKGVFWSGTYLYCPYMGVPPTPPPTPGYMQYRYDWHVHEEVNTFGKLTAYQT